MNEIFSINLADTHAQPKMSNRPQRLNYRHYFLATRGGWEGLEGWVVSTNFWIKQMMGREETRNKKERLDNSKLYVGWKSKNTNIKCFLKPKAKPDWDTMSIWYKDIWGEECYIISNSPC